MEEQHSLPPPQLYFVPITRATLMSRSNMHGSTQKPEKVDTVVARRPRSCSSLLPTASLEEIPLVTEIARLGVSRTAKAAVTSNSTTNVNASNFEEPESVVPKEEKNSPKMLKLSCATKRPSAIFVSLMQLAPLEHRLAWATPS